MEEASTITMTASLTSSINIKLAFEILPIIYPKNLDGSNFVHPKNTRNKIPYFGVENAIVCVKYKGKIRGIRQNEGQMNNVVSLDLQTGNKNINLKLAKTRVQLTGATSDTMGEKSFEVLCSHINLVQDHLNHIRNLPDNVREKTIHWVNSETLPKEGNKIPKFNYPYILEKSQEVPNVDIRFAMFLWQFTEDFEDYTDFNRKFKSVVEICYSKEDVILETDTVGICDCKISNSVYNYNIGLEVSLIELTKFLHKKGFNVQFHNWNSTHLKVSIPIMDEISDFDNEFETKTVESVGSAKIKAHRFSIHRGGGSIKQTSPSNSAAASAARRNLLSAISEFSGVEI
jgi:hypothetical protein